MSISYEILFHFHRCNHTTLTYSFFFQKCKLKITIEENPVFGATKADVPMNLAIILAVLRNRKISLIESNKFICSSLYEILKDNQNKILGHHSTSSGTAFI